MLHALILAAAALWVPTADSPVSAETLSLFRTLKVQIALPRYMPPGFQVAAYSIEPGHPPGHRGIGVPAYHILYRRGVHECLAFDSGWGGLGGADVSQYKTLGIRSKFLGNPPLQYNATSFFILGVDERATDGRWYDISHTGSWPRATVKGCTKSISPQEARRVAESIQPI
ncbi:MAG: hypothetical protein M3N19_07495 [Candidatus Eremiobacteraeota bacterium]|nr:hypothetical protein [Candidatus Eremiobacteraeota bacterium]